MLLTAHTLTVGTAANLLHTSSRFTLHTQLLLRCTDYAPSCMNGAMKGNLYSKPQTTPQTDFCSHSKVVMYG
jgi:hypothetical protein